jgi:hypothetical protein
MTLDRDRIEKTLWTVWREFIQDLEITPVGEVQDLRAFSVLWIALFVPEAISPRFQSAMTAAALQWRERPDFGHSIWFRILPVEAALYALTGDPFWVSLILSNLDHHNSSLRTMAIETLAPIADRLTFGAAELTCVEHNIDVRHFFWEWPVILLAISRTAAGEKRQRFAKWLETYELDPPGREIVEKLAAGETVENPFLYRLLRIQQFLSLQFACAPPQELRQFDLDPDRKSETGSFMPEQPGLFSQNPMDFADLVWERISAHPLTALMVQIRSDL